MCYWDRRLTYPKKPGKNFDLIAIRGRVAIWEPRRCSQMGRSDSRLIYILSGLAAMKNPSGLQMEGEMASIWQPFKNNWKIISDHFLNQS